MVSERHSVIGLDRDGASICMAEVAFESGRERIVALRETTPDMTPHLGLEPSSAMVVAVPDRAAIVKRLAVPKPLSISVSDYCRFEIEQSLLDSPGEFCLDHYHVEETDSVLGFAIRRERLSENLQSYGFSNGSSPPPDTGCRTRALALGLGYLSFCDGHPGRVTGLADICTSGVSLCLIHDRRIVMVSYLGAEGYDPRSYDGRHRLAIELKTVFNFLTDSSRSAEVSQPLSHLLLSGSGLDSELEEVVGDYFPGSVSRAKINTGFLANPGELDNIVAERFLVALGLTVK
jgi:hypothetical protein